MTQPGELLATGAATATHPAGPCGLCDRAILPGERYAHLVPYDALAHLPCVAAMATPRRRVPVIR